VVVEGYEGEPRLHSTGTLSAEGAALLARFSLRALYHILTQYPAPTMDCKMCMSVIKCFVDQPMEDIHIVERLLKGLDPKFLCIDTKEIPHEEL
jgi:hypothetical protein